MIILYLLLLLCIFVCLLCKSKRYLHMLQQNLYNENNRYIKWILRNGKLFWDLDLAILTRKINSLFKLFNAGDIILISEDFLVMLSNFSPALIVDVILSITPFFAVPVAKKGPTKSILLISVLVPASELSTS